MSAKGMAQSAKSYMEKERPKFRFMDLEIWRDSIEIAEKLFDLADKLETRRFYRFAEQLRGSGLSMSIVTELNKLTSNAPSPP